MLNHFHKRKDPDLQINTNGALPIQLSKYKQNQTINYTVYIRLLTKFKGSLQLHHDAENSGLSSLETTMSTTTMSE